MMSVMIRALYLTVIVNSVVNAVEEDDTAAMRRGREFDRRRASGNDQSENRRRTALRKSIETFIKRSYWDWSGYHYQVKLAARVVSFKDRSINDIGNTRNAVRTKSVQKVLDKGAQIDTDYFEPVQNLISQSYAQNAAGNTALAENEVVFDKKVDETKDFLGQTEKEDAGRLASLIGRTNQLLKGAESMISASLKNARGMHVSRCDAVKKQADKMLKDCEKELDGMNKAIQAKTKKTEDGCGAELAKGQALLTSLEADLLTYDGIVRNTLMSKIETMEDQFPELIDTEVDSREDGFDTLMDTIDEAADNTEERYADHQQELEEHMESRLEAFDQANEDQIATAEGDAEALLTEEEQRRAGVMSDAKPTVTNVQEMVDAMKQSVDRLEDMTETMMEQFGPEFRDKAKEAIAALRAHVDSARHEAKEQFTSKVESDMNAAITTIESKRDSTESSLGDAFSSAEVSDAATGPDNIADNAAKAVQDKVAELDESSIELSAVAQSAMKAMETAKTVLQELQSANHIGQATTHVLNGFQQGESDFAEQASKEAANLAAKITAALTTVNEVKEEILEEAMKKVGKQEKKADKGMSSGSKLQNQASRRVKSAVTGAESAAKKIQSQLPGELERCAAGMEKLNAELEEVLAKAQEFTSEAQEIAQKLKAFAVDKSSEASSDANEAVENLKSTVQQEVDTELTSKMASLGSEMTEQVGRFAEDVNKKTSEASTLVQEFEAKFGKATDENQASMQEIADRIRNGEDSLQEPMTSSEAELEKLQRDSTSCSDAESSAIKEMDQGVGSEIAQAKSAVEAESTKSIQDVKSRGESSYNDVKSASETAIQGMADVATEAADQVGTAAEQHLKLSDIEQLLKAASIKNGEMETQSNADLAALSEEISATRGMTTSEYSRLQGQLGTEVGAAESSFNQALAQAKADGMNLAKGASSTASVQEAGLALSTTEGLLSDDVGNARSTASAMLMGEQGAVEDALRLLNFERSKMSKEEMTVGGELENIKRQTQLEEQRFNKVMQTHMKNALRAAEGHEEEVVKVLNKLDAADADAKRRLKSMEMDNARGLQEALRIAALSAEQLTPRLASAQDSTDAYVKKLDGTTQDVDIALEEARKYSEKYPATIGTEATRMLGELDVEKSGRVEKSQNFVTESNAIVNDVRKSAETLRGLVSKAASNLLNDIDHAGKAGAKIDSQLEDLKALEEYQSADKLLEVVGKKNKLVTDEEALLAKFTEISESSKDFQAECQTYFRNLGIELDMSALEVAEQAGVENWAVRQQMNTIQQMLAESMHEQGAIMSAALQEIAAEAGKKMAAIMALKGITEEERKAMLNKLAREVREKAMRNMKEAAAVQQQEAYLDRELVAAIKEITLTIKRLKTVDLASSISSTVRPKMRELQSKLSGVSSQLKQAMEQQGLSFIQVQENAPVDPLLKETSSMRNETESWQDKLHQLL